MTKRPESPAEKHRAPWFLDTRNQARKGIRSYLSIDLSIYLSIYPSIHLSIDFSAVDPNSEHALGTGCSFAPGGLVASITRGAGISAVSWPSPGVLAGSLPCPGRVLAGWACPGLVLAVSRPCPCASWTPRGSWRLLPGPGGAGRRARRARGRTIQ